MLLTPGRHDLGFRYRPGEPATGTLLVDGEVVGARRRSSSSCGAGSRSPAPGSPSATRPASRPPIEDYDGPFRFTGTSSGPGSTSTASRSLDPEAEAEAAIARQ